MDGAVGDEGHLGSRVSHYSVAFIPVSCLDGGVVYLTMPMVLQHHWVQESEEWVREIVYVNIATYCGSSIPQLLFSSQKLPRALLFVFSKSTSSQETYFSNLIVDGVCVTQDIYISSSTTFDSITGAIVQDSSAEKPRLWD